MVRADRSRVLTWKYEDGFGDDNDVGPAWIAHPDGRSEQVEGGEWMTRGQARAFATTHGCEFFEDDGRGGVAHDERLTAEVESINARLRALGIGREELELSALTNGDVFALGTWYEQIAEPIKRPNPLDFRSAGGSMSLDEAVEAIRALVPDWET